MVGALASGQAVDIKDVLTPVGAVLGAAIAGFVAWFNSRKTPADRLEELIGLYKGWPAGLPGDEHLADLIRGQLGALWHRYPHSNLATPSVPSISPADDSTAALASSDEAIARIAKKHLHIDGWAVGLSLIALIGCALVLVCFHRDTAILPVVGLIGGFAVVVAVAFGVRVIRHWVWDCGR
jgi:hypothetical protein